MKEEINLPTTESLSISFETNLTFDAGDHERRADLRIEKISIYAGALFDLIERSCEDYVPLLADEIDIRRAHEHFMTIKEAAELGKHLVK